MKKFVSKIIATLLALVVLLSTFSFNVEKHFCGDSLVAISYVGNVASCDDVEEDSCESKTIEPSCCKDDVEFLKGQTQIQKSLVEKVTFTKVITAVTSYTYYKQLFSDLKRQLVPHKFYIPPKLFFDIQVLHEVFII
ncbi:HYC_CC_PP family protein [Tenacibaculum aestuarii]|uniref:HYC_CC_PP family protein n=1 Tax=Tenacibaculum aestuarii TaxID=362781 RepID=UPI0038944B19